MTLIEQAIQDHKKAGFDFQEWWDYFMHCGYVLKTPTLLVMAEPFYDDEYGDAWMIWYFAKHHRESLASILKFVPFELPYVAFARGLRNNVYPLKFYKFEKLKHALNFT